jgi:membrane-associated protease RseP (regulator of RpoE activity)
MTSLDEVEPRDEARSFRRAPGWQRLIVLTAGSFMHFVIAAVLIFGLALGLGVVNGNSTQLATVATCVPASEQALQNGTSCPAGSDNSPAARAGLRVGDTVTAFDGTPVSSWDRLTSEINKVKPGTPVTLTVDRNGHPVTLHTTLVNVSGHGSYLGVAPAVVYQRQSVLGSVKYVGTGFSEVITGSASALKALPSAVPELFSKNRSSTAAGNVSSVVGAARETGQAVASSASWQAKVEFVLLLIASLNIFVGVLNLLPLLPLDGGHIAVVLYERVRAWFARLRHHADPGLVDYRKLVPVSFGVFLVIIAFGTMLILADIVNPVNIG